MVEGFFDTPVLALRGRVLVSSLMMLALAGAQPPPISSERQGNTTGYGVFQTRCMSCHGNPAATERAPDPAALRQLAPEAIYEALTTGVMKIQGQALTDDQKRRVAEAITQKPIGATAAGDAKTMPNRCRANPPLSDPSASPAWNGWGVDSENTRFQSAKAAGLTADQVPRLKLKWAFGYPNGVSAYGQPTIVSGRVFTGSDNGFVYSLDAATGCVYWSFQAKGGVRTAIDIGPVKGHGSAKYAAYFGDMKANVYAVDASTGEQLWTERADEHFTSRVTGAAALHSGRLYVPISSWEEYQGSSLDYPCCTFRGSVVAFNANTGARIWKTYVIPEEPKPAKKNSRGTQLYAPAGAAVWNAPTVDAKRHAIYFGTGDSETEPAAKTSDAVMAVDMDTGKVLWVYQAQAGDAFMGGCGAATRTENCPEENGPDLDIGNSPILRTLASGRTILVAGTKDGNVFALDPDKKGELVWKTSVAKNSLANAPARLNGIVWGGAADTQNVYYGLSGGGAVAVQLATGERAWFTPLGPAGVRISNAAAATAIPGVTFVGGSDGKLHALSTVDGHPIWEFDMDREFPTVNKVPAKGGSMGAPGVTIAGGMLFAGSGYGQRAGDKTGNVLLAFSLE